MGTESLAAALEREHHEIDEGIAAFTASPWDPQPLERASRALRRHIYLEEEFLFPLLHQAEPALAAPIFVMLREHAQIWATLDTLEREPARRHRSRPVPPAGLATPAPQPEGGTGPVPASRRRAAPGGSRTAAGIPRLR